MGVKVIMGKNKVREEIKIQWRNGKQEDIRLGTSEMLRNSVYEGCQCAEIWGEKVTDKERIGVLKK